MINLIVWLIVIGVLWGLAERLLFGYIAPQFVLVIRVLLGLFLFLLVLSALGVWTPPIGLRR